MKVLQKENGFSLIEVVAAIVIIGIVLLSFSQIFIQTSKTAHKNNEKLTTINLADAMLVRLKAESFIHNQTITDVNNYFKDMTESDPTKKKPPTLIKMNDKEYKVSYVASQSNSLVNNATYSEKDLKLVKVVVTVTAPDGKTKGSSEGYVALE
ncbi:type II secretion system protein [Solibacillus sp. A46]|uniref:Type II secretion system protein n=1 Tax=Solibacillus faecavium TaxID=2762221 RepID=A0ABR8Y220_9BACL|nr:type II secretion system protein [Solibacillus faecavium]MBD8038249.1 type II secretion system protein [Solibacillus faecavium]